MRPVISWEERNANRHVIPSEKALSHEKEEVANVAKMAVIWETVDCEVWLFPVYFLRQAESHTEQGGIVMIVCEEPDEILNLSFGCASKH